MWLTPKGDGQSVADYLTSNRLHLVVLMGIHLMSTWGATLNLITVVAVEASRAEALSRLEEINDLSGSPTRPPPG